MRYVLTDEFKPLEETTGTVVNISGFKAEINTTGESGTGIILYPRRKLSFSETIYAARAPGEVGTPIIATIPFAESGCGSPVDPDETVTDEDIAGLFGSGDEEVTDDDINSIFNGGSSNSTVKTDDDETVTDEDIGSLFP